MRKEKAKKRFLQPDPVYQDTTVTKFINCLMKGGNKSVVARILYQSFDIIEKKTKKKGYKTFQEALEKTGPVVVLESRRVHGATYQIPIQARPEKKLFLAIKWIKESAARKKGTNMALALANTLIQASQGEGDAIKKKETMHKMAQANKSFSHFKF